MNRLLFSASCCDEQKSVWINKSCKLEGIVRAPDYHKDGWCLDDGEQRHREAPETFWIPDLELRQILQPGDFVQLIFRINAAGDEEVERMWVIVRERVPGGYVGMLDNTPSTIAENDEFWLGAELPFEYKHIIAAKPGNEHSKELANAPVPIPWKRMTENST